MKSFTRSSPKQNSCFLCGKNDCLMSGIRILQYHGMRTHTLFVKIHAGLLSFSILEIFYFEPRIILSFFLTNKECKLE